MPVGKYVSFAVYVGHQKLPEYKIKDDVFTEVDLHGPSSYTIEEDGQKYPVVPFTIEIIRWCRDIVWITVLLDGQKVASRPLLGKMMCNGVKSGREIHELLFSLPRMVEDQEKENPLGDYAGTISIQVQSVRCVGEKLVPVYKTDSPSSGVREPQVLHHLTKKDVQRALHYNTGGVVSREGRSVLSLVRTDQMRRGRSFIPQDHIEEVTLIYRPRIFSNVPQSASLILNPPTNQEEEDTQCLTGKRKPLGDVGNCSFPEKMCMSPATKPDSLQKSFASKEDQCPSSVPSGDNSLEGERSHAVSKHSESYVVPAGENKSQESSMISSEEIKRRESGLILPAQAQHHNESLIPPEEIKHRESGIIPLMQTQHHNGSLIPPEEIKRRESGLIPLIQTQHHNGSLIPPEEIKRRESGLIPLKQTQNHNGSLIPPEEIKRRESGLIPLMQTQNHNGSLIPPEEIKRRESGLIPLMQTQNHNGSLISQELKHQQSCMISPEQIKRRESYLIPVEQIKRQESISLDQIKRRESGMMEVGESADQPVDQIKCRESSVFTSLATQHIYISDDEDEVEISEVKIAVKREKKGWGELSYVVIGDSDDEDGEMYVYEYEDDSVVYMGDDDCCLMDLSENISLIDLENSDLDDELDLS